MEGRPCGAASGAAAVVGHVPSAGRGLAPPKIYAPLVPGERSEAGQPRLLADSGPSRVSHRDTSLPTPSVAGTYRGRRPNFDEKPSEVLRDPDMEESTKTLAESLSIVKVQRVQLKRYLDMDHVMDALKSASTMLSELRTSSLTPKHYYELYMAVLDALRHLSIYLYDAHTGGKHHLADLYELVQYCGHIVPRPLPHDHRRQRVHVRPRRARQGDHEGHDGNEPRRPAPDARPLSAPLPLDHDP